MREPTSDPTEPPGPLVAAADASPPTTDAALYPHLLVAGRYEVLAKLGSGGMGSVYRVRDIELDEEVALKILHSSYAETEGALERFRREVKLARLVTHPNVARMYDFGSTARSRFLTMELVLGTSLGSRMKSGERFALPEVLRIVGDVARGLAAAHAAGVVHRDLKPDNILLDGRALAERGAERVVLTDFGIAVLAEGRAPRVEPTGSFFGTPEYMAPEQIQGREADGRADVYALGVVLFELLANRLPIDGPSPYAIVAARLSGDAPKLRSVEPNVPDPVAALTDQMLVRSREARPDMLRVVDAIDALRGGGKSSFVLARTSRPPDGEAITAVTTVLVAPFAWSGEKAESLAGQLADGVGDALSASRSVRVIPWATVHPEAIDGTETALDARALAQRHEAAWVVVGSVQSENARTRLRVRIIEVESGALSWARKFDGAEGALLDLQDEVCRDVVATVVELTRAGETSRQAPVGGTGTWPDVDSGAAEDHENAMPAMPPDARILYDRGIAAVREYGDHIEQGIEALREANRLAPNDAHVMSALGAALVRQWSFSDKIALLGEAEDWSLRALATGTRIGETFATIGVLRLHQGELRAAVNAFREASARSPRLSEPHSYLGRLLSESGHVAEARRRLDRAVELDPGDHHAMTESARIAAMQRDWRRAESLLEAAAAATPRASGILLATKARFAVWRRDDPEYLAAAVHEIELRATDPSLRVVVRLLLPIWKALVAGDVLLTDDPRLAALREAAGGPSLRLTMFWYQLLAEIGGTLGHGDEALEAVEAASMRTLIDVHWLDRCPALESLRTSARHSRARATVAARAAALWR